MFAPMAAGMGGMMAPEALEQMPKSKPTGMFGAGKGNIGEIISAAINGYLAAGGNQAGAMGLQMLHQRRNQQASEQQHQQRRGEDFDDWVKKQAWEIANNPKSQQPHYFEDNSGNLMAVGPDGKPTMVHKDPLQWKLVPNGMGGVVPVNLSQLMGGQGGAQQPPPVLSDDDWPTQGGPTPPASGGFPRPF